MKKPPEFDMRWNGRSIPQKHWHFQRQLLARYGFVLAPGEFAQMIRDIRQGDAQLIAMRSRRTGIYSVRLRQRFERIYVLSNGKDVLTAWPPEKWLNGIRQRMNERGPVVWLRPVIDENDVSQEPD